MPEHSVVDWRRWYGWAEYVVRACNDRLDLDICEACGFKDSGERMGGIVV